MGLELQVDYPHYEKGLELDLSGILVKNGGTTKLTDAQEEAFVAREGKSVKDALAENEYVKVSGTAAMTPAKVEAAKEGENS